MKPGAEKPQGHEALADHWISITLTLVSIIEGLAFSHLASRVPHLLHLALNSQVGDGPYTFRWLAKYVHLVNALPAFLAAAFCFVVILRILQTYITAVIDYRKTVDLREVLFGEFLIMFLIGALQYLLIDSVVPLEASADLAAPNATVLRPLPFAFYTMVISTLAMAGYFLTLTRVVNEQKDNAAMDSKELASEVVLQLANLAGLLVTFMAAVIIFLNQSVAVLVPTISAMILAMSFNIFYSVTKTFDGTGSPGVPIPRVEADHLAGHARRPRPRYHPKVEPRLSAASDDDVDHIARFLVRDFGYIYRDRLFQADEKDALRMTAHALRFASGRSSIGVSRFRKLTLGRQVVAYGLMRSKKEPAWRGFLWLAAITAAYLRHHPHPNVFKLFVGLLEMVHLADTSRSTDVLEYIHVCPEARGFGAGRRMLQELQDEAFRLGAGSLSASVRSKNAKAISLFKEQGFSVEGVRPEPIAELREEQGHVIVFLKERGQNGAAG